MPPALSASATASCPSRSTTATRTIDRAPHAYVDHREFAGGCRFTRRDDDAWMAAELLPPRLVSACDCLVDKAPGTWALAWATHTDAERTVAAAAFGLDAAATAEAIAWTTAAFEQGIVGWPDVFFALDDARAFARRFIPATVEVFVAGIALPDDLAATLLATVGPVPGASPSGVDEALRREEAAVPEGEFLGFEVLGYEHGGFHSFVCNGLERAFRDALGVVPNAHGLYEEEADARRCAAHAGCSSTGAEPGLWLPWRFTRYAR